MIKPIITNFETEVVCMKYPKFLELIQLSVDFVKYFNNTNDSTYKNKNKNICIQRLA